jgi:selenocysteine-specific elongation factor
MDIVVGTAGHIDHGKTTLVKALTGTDTDRLPEEKKRGITIDLGFAEMEHNGVHFGFVDVPGHERFVKNMLAGAGGIDLVMLVVAADEGVMPQTREHFEICRLLGVETGLIVLTKSDLADKETVELVLSETEELAAGSFLESSVIIPASAKTGEGLDSLRSTLAEAAEKIVGRDKDVAARLAVDRSFTKKGFGSVVTGTLASGELHDGDELDLLPQGRTVRVRGLQTHGRSVKTATAGNRVAVNLAGIDHDEVARGMLLAEKGTLRPTQTFDAEIEVLAGAKPLRSRQRVRVHIGAAEVLARISVINEAGEIAEGSKGMVQLRLEAPVATIIGERFVIRSYSPQTTVAGGTVLDPFPIRHKRKSFGEVARCLSEIAEARNDRDALLRTIVDQAGVNAIDLGTVRAETGWKAASASEAIRVNADTVVSFGDHLFTRSALEEVKVAVMQRIESFHKREPLAAGIGRETLRKTIPGGDAFAVIAAAIEELSQSGKIRADGDNISAAGRGAQLKPEEAKAKERFIEVYESAKLEPPKLNDVLAEARALNPANARQVFQLLIDSGEIIKVSDEFYFSASAINDLKRQLVQFAYKSADRKIDVAKFKDLAGVSRKYAIPLLEYFDREKITVRSGDARLILK